MSFFRRQLRALRAGRVAALVAAVAVVTLLPLRPPSLLAYVATADSVFVRARALFDSSLAVAAGAIEPLRATVRPAATAAASLPEGESASTEDAGCGLPGQPACSPCGGEGQRACTIPEQIGGLTLSCKDGRIEIPGCTGDCDGPLGFDSSGMCVTKSPCGGKGQRACTILERIPSCNDGLVEVPGCSGDCWGVGGKSLGMCTSTVLDTIAEPTTNAIPEIGSCSLKGYSDMHMHMFAHMAHGGGVLAGKPYDETGGVNAALKPDFTTELDLVNGDGSELGTWAEGVEASTTDGSDIAETLRELQNLFSGLIIDLFPCPFGSLCSQDFLHGVHDPLLGDPVGSFIGTKDGAGLSNFGAPLFNGWPKWTSTTHQQVYYKWLERAWQGGLRHMTELAVTNEALCRGSKHIKGVDCKNGMAAIDAQINAAYAFQSFVDNKHGGPGKGWYRIVTSPLQARKAIAEGKLAVTLGIETAELFNCYENGSCTKAQVLAKVDEYYARGVRHVFPIHNFDNAFGAAATWQDGIEVGQRVVEGRWWQTRDCGPGNGDYGFKLGISTQVLITLLKFTTVIPTTESLVDHSGETATCNRQGLRQLGRDLITKLMDMGMIIDVDHMSAIAFDETLSMAEARGYSGIAASHVLSFDRHERTIQHENETKGTRHERLRTEAQLLRIKNLGGMIAAMLKDDGQDTGLKGAKYTIAYENDVADDCRHSSKTFAHAYQYAVDKMGGPVALGSDFNGVAGHIGPRFGLEACGGHLHERNAQLGANNKVAYPFTLAGFGTFNRQVTGQRTFDYNYDGMAHVGLVPDFIEDLKKVGMPQSYVDKLFGSAEAYIKMWERARGDTAPDDSCTFDYPPETPPSGVLSGPTALTVGASGQFTLDGFPTENDVVLLTGLTCGEGSLANVSGNQVWSPSLRVTFSCRFPANQPFIVITAILSDDDGDRRVQLTVFNNTVPSVVLEGPDRSTVGKQEQYFFTVHSASGIDPKPVASASSCGAHGLITGGPAAISAGLGDTRYVMLCRFTQASSSNTISVAVEDHLGNVTVATKQVVIGRPPDSLLAAPSILGSSTLGSFSIQGYSTDDDDVSLVSITCGAGNPETKSEDLFTGTNKNLEVRFTCRFPSGPSTVVVTATIKDIDGETVTTKAVQVFDNAPPIVTVPRSPIRVMAHLPEGAFVRYDATAWDDFDGNLDPVCSPDSDSIFPLKATASGLLEQNDITVTCTATDRAGLVGSASFRVLVEPDRTPPAVIVPQALAPPHHWRLDDGFRGGADDDVGPRSSSSTILLDSGVATSLLHGKPLAYLEPVDRASCVGTGERALKLTAENGSVIDFGNEVLPPQTDSSTTAFWFKPDRTHSSTLSGNRVVLLSSRISPVDIGGLFEVSFMYLDIPTAPKFSVEVEFGRRAVSGAGVIEFASTVLSEPVDATQDSWHHIAVTQRRTAEFEEEGRMAVSLYVDGRLVDSTLFKPIGPVRLPLVGGGTPAMLNGTTPGSFAGLLDELQMFDRELNDTEIISMFRAYPDTSSSDPCEPLGDLVVESTSAQGIAVDFTASVKDVVFPDVPVTCTPASGSTFPIGATQVLCTATNPVGSFGTASFIVKVNRLLRPTVTVPPDITEEATGPNGVRVTYDASAADADGNALTPSCLPASDTTFPLGETVVECTATVEEGGVEFEATETFKVTVRDTTPPSVTCGSPDGLWHGADVSVDCTASDVVGLADAADERFSLVTTVLSWTETANAVTNSRSVCDAAANCATAGAIGGHKIDKKAPAIGCAGPDDQWHGEDVSIACTANDGGSGLADTSFSLSTSVADDAETADAATNSRNVCDAVGNCATASPIGGNMIDKKAPAISCGTPDGQWHADNASISCTASDAGSGVVDPAFSLTTNVPPGTETSDATAEGRNVCDAVGNCTTAAAIGGNRIDRKAPAMSCGAPDGAWHPDDVLIGCTASDGGAGLGPISSFQLATNVPANSESADAFTNSANICDVVGNCTTAAAIGGNKVDKKAPEISCAAADGRWHGDNVGIACTASDGGSGVADGAFLLTTNVPPGTETADAVTNERDVCDAVGNCATAAALGGNKVDRRAPAISCGGPDGQWHNDNVSIGCTASDGGSGVTDAAFSLATNVPLGAETADASTNDRNVCDVVGNCATATPIGGNKIDRKGPSIGCGAPDGLWHAADVAIGCAAADGGSGLASGADAAFALATTVPAGTETANASTDGRTVCDAVGNCTTQAPIPGIRVDKKAPDIVVTRTPAPNPAGWNNRDVVATFTASDGGSGLAGPPAIEVVFSAEGANQSAERTFTDNVGNTASASIGNINIDKTAPTLTCSNNAPSLWPPNHKLITVTASVQVDGGASGASAFTLTSAISNEPDNGLGDGDTANDIQAWMFGTADTGGMFRAERSGKGTGRIYTLAYQGLDVAGNVGTCTTTVSVVHDQGTGGKK